MTRVLLLCVLLGACSAPPPTPAPEPLVMPDGLSDCPASAPVPHALPKVRTPAMLAAGYNTMEDARRATAHARDECAARLQRLNEWVQAHLNR